MEKSELFMAWRPSRPAMPTPTCASWIMGTSFAPSPMASVTGCGLTPCRTMRTICAFCSGDTRQPMTMEQVWAILRKASLVLGFASIASSATPVTIRASCLPLSPASLRLDAMVETSLCTWLASSVLSRVAMYISSVRTRELKPMLRAVSSLSPVNTQSLMPACRTFTMVSGTWSCSLSSMAVAPTISMPTSISSAAAARAASRSPNCRSAACCF
mmetsp:Transcript_3497/g.10967  ORF Transcript_3497/g.10967 Transcript_3497/m.10967 type:complete len:215 (+) Transcript_3497:1860-2504(+)